MARAPSPTKTHRAKDFCTIEQAEYIATLVVQRHEAARRFLKPHRKAIRFIRRNVGRLSRMPRILGESARAALRISRS